MAIASWVRWHGPRKGPLNCDARLTIDASGDADLVAMAGFESFIGDGKDGMSGQVQNPTMIFRLGGVDTARFVATYGEERFCRSRYPSFFAVITVTVIFCHGQRYGCFRRLDQTSCCVTAARCRPDGRELNTLNARDFTMQIRRALAGARVRALLSRLSDRLRAVLRGGYRHSGRRASDAAGAWGGHTRERRYSYRGASLPTVLRARPGRSSYTQARSRVSNGCSKIATKYLLGALFPFVGMVCLPPGAASRRNTKRWRRPA